VDTDVPHELSKIINPYIDRKLSTEDNPAENPFRHQTLEESLLEDAIRYGWDPDRRKRE
jgi:hypothetical protein